MSEEELDLSKLSLEDKLSHKSWKARQHGYDELVKKFQTLPLDDKSAFEEYESYLKGMVSDANQIALESGVKAVLEYVKSCPSATRVQGTIAPLVVEKCLPSMRAGTRATASELLLTFIEIDSPGTVVESLISLFTHKTPKTVVAVVSMLKEVLSQYGYPTVNLKPFAKALPTVFDHRDKNVRAEATNLAIEMYKWMGTALLPSLNELKPIQLKELSAAFEALPQERPTPQRYRRADKAKMEAAAAVSSAEGTGAPSTPASSTLVSAPVAAPDAYEFADPVAILDKIPKTFYQDLGSSKWKERKEALEGLLSILSAPKFEDGRYHELMNALAKRVADANIIVVALATNCIEKMARGLRKDFSQYRSIVVGPLIERTKERKTNVLEALRGALDAVFLSCSFLDLLDDMISSFSHKNPQTKTEGLQWLIRCLRSGKVSKKDLNNQLKTVAESLVKVLDDGTDHVRDAGAEAFAILIAILTERPLIPYLERLDKVKHGRVMDYVAKSKGSVTASANDASAAKTVSSTASSVLKPKPKVGSTTATKSAGSKPSVPASSAPKRSTSSPMPKSASAPAMTSLKADADEPVSFKYTEESAGTYLTETFAQVSVGDLTDSNWKTRLAAAQSLLEAVTAKIDQGDDVEAEACICYLSKKPGFKETNFQVMSTVVGIFSKVANASSFSKACASLICGGLFDKIGDIKLKKPVGDCLTAIIESINFGFVLRQGLPSLEKQKSPKVIAEGLAFIAETLKLFGTKYVDVHGLAKFVVSCLGNANSAVRSNAIQVVGSLAGLLGGDVKFIFKDLPSQQQSLVDAEIEKAANRPKIQPSRAPAPKSSKVKSSTAQASAPIQSVEVEEDENESLFPRVNLSSKISSSLLEQLGSAAWKERKAALDELVGIINSTNMRIQPTLTFDFIQALKARLTDSNKNLACQTVDICASLTVAMGKPFEKYIRNLLPSILSHLSDQKQTIRTAIINALTKIVSSLPLPILISQISTALSAEQPVLRKELLKWLGDTLNVHTPEISSHSQEYEYLVHPLLLCFQDRNGDVRKNAQVVANIIAPLVGLTLFKEKSTEHFKGASLASLQPFLDAIRNSESGNKAREEPKATPAKSTSSTATPSRALKSEAHGLLDNTRQGLKRVGTVKVAPRKEETVSQSIDTAIKANATTEPAENVVLLTSDLRSKELREKADRGLNKWVFDSVRRELVDLLAEQAAPHIVPAVHALLFSADHYKEKDHLAGLKALNDFVSSPEYSGLDSADVQSQAVANCDIILKYLTIRFFDTNTVILNKSLEVLDNLLTVLDNASYCLSEYEASSFLPFFINKAGDAKETIRVKVRAILKKLGRVYPVSKLFVHVMKGLDSKNARTRTECLEELSCMIQRNGQTAFAPAKALPLIASQVGDRDANVRNGALNAITQAFKLLGEGVWKHLTKLSEKDKALVTERLRRIHSSGDLPTPTSSDSLASNTTAVLEALADQAGRSVANLKSRMARNAKAPAQTLAASSTLSQEVKREFSLDLDMLSLNNTKSGPTPPLANISKVKPATAILPSQRNVGPTSKSDMPTTAIDLSKYRAVLNRGILKSPPSEVNDTEDVTIVINALFERVGGNDSTEIFDSLKQLEKHVSISTQPLVIRISELVGILSLQMHSVITGPLSTDSLAVKLGKSLVAVLVQVFSNETTAKLVSSESLEACIQEVVIRLVDPILATLDPTNALSRALNMLMVRIIEKCDANLTIGILLKLLRKSADDCLGKSGDDLACQSRLTELIMKCLWKQTKTIRTLLSSQQLKPSPLLRDIDIFLTLTPPQEWKRRVAEGIIEKADMPWRTVRTILHELVNYYGENVLTFTSGLSHPMSSHTIMALKQMLQSNKVKRRIESNANTPIKSSDHVLRFSDDDAPSDAIAQIEAIIKMISNKEHTKEGVRALYEFRKKYPSTIPLIQARINQMSSFIQGYIERHLKAFEQEEQESPREASMGTSTIPLSTSSRFAFSNTLEQANTPGGLATAVKSEADVFGNTLSHYKERFSSQRDVSQSGHLTSSLHSSLANTPLKDANPTMTSATLAKQSLSSKLGTTLNDSDSSSVVAGLKSKLAKLKLKMDSTESGSSTA